MARKISLEDRPCDKDISLVGGIDVSMGRNSKFGRAAVSVVEFPSLSVVTDECYEGPIVMPYVPGLLSFRELPLILGAFRKLEVEPDLFIVDGQGIAHPRRLGLASHFGLFTNTPTIGCAKNRLCGHYGVLGESRGSTADLTDNNELIGRVVRTKEGCKPVFISAGNNISLGTAVDWILKLTGRYRLPEPIRQAHLSAGRNAIEQPNFAVK